MASLNRHQLIFFSVNIRSEFTSENLLEVAEAINIYKSFLAHYFALENIKGYIC